MSKETKQTATAVHRRIPGRRPLQWPFRQSAPSQRNKLLDDDSCPARRQSVARDGLCLWLRARSGAGRTGPRRLRDRHGSQPRAARGSGEEGRAYAGARRDCQPERAKRGGRPGVGYVRHHRRAGKQRGVSARGRDRGVQEVLDQYNTNVFGMLRVLRAVLPHMREKRAGIVANVGSAGGWTGIPGIGLYGSTKFAIAGITLALREEVTPLGIEVTVVEPGAFRTSILGKGFVPAKTPIEDFAPLTKPLTTHVENVSGKQPGDPAKAAQLLVEALTKSGRCAGKALPSRLLLGKDAVKRGRSVLEQNQRELDQWAELSVSTDFQETSKP